MDSGPGWLPDPHDGDRERYWNGSHWTDRVRPAGKARSLRLPDHVPELQRALAGATADIDAVEDRLSTMFDRDATPVSPSATRNPPAGHDTDDRRGIPALDDDPGRAPGGGNGGEDDGGDDGLAELDAALAAEEAEVLEEAGETKPRRGLFRRRS